MPTYIVLYRFTKDGRKDIKATVQRAAQVREANEARGFTIRAHLWTQGRYDLVTIVDAPNEDAMMAGLFNVAQAGNVYSETLRGFRDEDMERILALPEVEEFEWES